MATRRKPDKGTFLSIDPGLKGCGMAYWVDGTLTWCGVARFRKSKGPRQWVLMAEEVVRVYNRVAGQDSHVDYLAIERMETRKTGTKANSKRVHDDLFQLTYVSGAIYALLSWDYAFDIRPSWTRGRTKDVNYGISKKQLDAATGDEYDVLVDGVESAVVKHKYEVSDAVAIGLYCLRRFPR